MHTPFTVSHEPLPPPQLLSPPTLAQLGPHVLCCSSVRQTCEPEQSLVDEQLVETHILVPVSQLAYHTPLRLYWQLVSSEHSGMQVPPPALVLQILPAPVHGLLLEHELGMHWELLHVMSGSQSVSLEHVLEPPPERSHKPVDESHVPPPQPPLFGESHLLPH